MPASNSKMEKVLSFIGSYEPPSPHPPTAPPSYEEAIANVGEASMRPPVASPPYPMGTAAMPMPMPCNQPPSQTTVPASSTNPSSNQSTSQSRANIEVNSRLPPGVRIIHRADTGQHIIYALGPNPVRISCPTCYANIKSTTISDHQPGAHVCCIVLCLIGCCLCSCLPYCMSAFMSVHHFCPNCKSYIGTWKG